MNISVDFDEVKVKDKIINRFSLVQKKLDSQVLKDSNEFCPLDTSMLQKSVQISSVIGSGVLMWNTPYAKAQYYGIRFDHSKSQNPRAASMWFEKAKSIHINDWRKLVQNEYNRNP